MSREYRVVRDPFNGWVVYRRLKVWAFCDSLPDAMDRIYGVKPRFPGAAMDYGHGIEWLKSAYSGMAVYAWR
jgi:hypothetical protein